MNNKAFYIVAAIVLFAISGVVVYFTQNSKSESLAAPETKTDWVCDACAAHFALTADEVEAFRNNPQRSVAIEVKGTSFHFTALYCEKCKQLTVLPAEECPTHNTMNVIRHIDGTTASCPECAAEMKRRR